MQKPFLAVAASLLFVTPLFLAQAPAGPAQAPAGPDAAATNLVNGACASCHLLMKNEIQVYGVSAEFGRGKLSDYAGPTGGDVFPGTSTQSMEVAFSRITEQARNQYILTYVSNNETNLAVFRNIKVITRSSKDTVIHRSGYTQYPVR